MIKNLLKKNFYLFKILFKNNPNVYCYSEIEVWWSAYDSVKADIILSEGFITKRQRI